MITIQTSVGKRGVNQTGEVAKIQLALFELQFLSLPDFKKECIELLMTRSSADNRQAMLSNQKSFVQKLELLPNGNFTVSADNLDATILAIREFQKKKANLSRPDGRVDPDGRSLRTINREVKKLPKEILPTDFDENANREHLVMIDGENINIRLSKEGRVEEKLISIEKSRAFILKNYNWNGIIKLMRFVYKKNNDVYSVPTQLKGLPEDDILIVPDKGIQYVVQQQLAHELRFTEIRRNNLRTIFRPVDGAPGRSFRQNILQQKRGDFCDESANDSFKNVETEAAITIPSLEDDEAVLYQFFREITRMRNGLWSDLPEVVNIVGLRRELDPEAHTIYNDTLAVCWRSTDGNLKCQLNVSTTEPGERLVSNQLLPQTMTMLLGYHKGRQPAGRTRQQVIFDRKNNGKKSWKIDIGMNFHQGGNAFKLVGNQWLNKYGFVGNVLLGVPTNRFDGEQLFEMNRVLSEIFLILSKYGRNKLMPPYPFLKSLAEARPIHIESIVDDEIQVREEGHQQAKKISIRHGKEFLVNKWSRKRLQSEKNKIYDILKAISDLPEAEIEGWKTLSKAQLLEKIEDRFIVKMVEKQIEFFPNLSDVDGLGGDGFFSVAAGFRQSRTQAKEDFQRIEILLERLSRLPLRRMNNRNSILNILKNQMLINTDLHRFNVKKFTQKDPDRNIVVMKNIRVGPWSKGCQVIYDTEVFYKFWVHILERAEASGQRRWYYTLIDATEWEQGISD